MRTRMLVPIISALITALALSGVAHAGDGGGKKQKTSFTVTGPLAQISAPFCDAEQHCLFPATRTGTFAGDWTGTGIAVGGAATSQDGRFGTAQTRLFSGTIEGCGTGTLAFVAIETGELGTSGVAEGKWEILEGFGTGDLADVTGRGTGRSESIEAGGQAKGTIRCG